MARDRERKAKSATRVPLLQRPSIAVLIGLASWILSLVVIHVGEAPGLFGDTDRVRGLVSAVVLLGIGLSGSALYLQLSPDPGAQIQGNRRILLLAGTALFGLVFCKLVEMIPIVDEISWFSPHLRDVLVPVAITPLLATILAGRRAGVAAGIWNTFGVGALSGFSTAIVLSGFALTLLTPLVADRVRTRTQIFRIGLLIGMAQVIGNLAHHVRIWPLPAADTLLFETLACIASGGIAAILVLLALGIFESSFRITTDVTLLELSDLGRPLMQRMALEAPGTYHHSLVLANLSQAAADAIGANGLLARVCCYYHDIGKLTKPEFFTENIHHGESPHDDLSPSMSTLVITSHVKEGVSLARLHKLPEQIIDIIREHHGTGLVRYFHHKAQTQMEFETVNGPGTDAQRVEEGAFRYPGPTPRTKESAIISLGDAIEGASRSMGKYTPAAIEQLVNELVDGRIADRQLDRAILSFDELTRVKRTFVFTLMNTYHSRVAYPKDENRDKQQTAQRPTEPASDSEGGDASDAAGPDAGSADTVG